MLWLKVTGLWVGVGLFWGALMGMVLDLSWPAGLGLGVAWGVVAGLVFCVWMRRRARDDER
ncbi:hypothetical protein ABT127_04410 [Streptomyces sp. NPDC001904]|uniref:hypothetical protein n=1 Tax=Streptomyces sp. NPDC001904 TaxID=3154531 RepID=UPI003317CC1B